MEQEVCFTHDFDVKYREGKLSIVPKIGTEIQKVTDYIYRDKKLRNLHVIVGKTGSGKTNLLQLIGMDHFRRCDEEKDSAYLMIYKMAGNNAFLCEVVGLEINGMTDEKKEKQIPGTERCIRFEYNFEHGTISNVKTVKRDEHENTYIVNTFDRYAFAHCPYSDNRENMDNEGLGQFLFRKISPYGRDSVSMECEYLQDYLQQFAEDSIKRKAAFVITSENWQNVLKNEIPKKAAKRYYWTFKKRAFDLRMESFRKGKNGEITYPEFLTPKKRFLHDLMMDFAIYLRKWADCIGHREDYGYMQEAGIRNPTVLPDREKMPVLKRINWLCQYIDWHSGSDYGNKGLMWQIGDDIKGIYHELDKMPDKYFTEDEFRIPVMEIDLSKDSPMSELFERMDQYRVDELDAFCKELLPYHWTGVSSGEYQYAKVWGVFYEYSSKVRIGDSQKTYGEFVEPNMIVLMDEPESYMHPEMCRRFIHKMGEIMRHGGSNRELQIIMSTHSPFMLSDVLMEQVIKMDVDEHGCCHIMQGSGKPYYAANIHSIMADGFFLDYTIGEEARVFLSEKFSMLKGFVGRELGYEERLEVENMKMLLPYIGDELIRYSFENLIKLIG